MFSGGKLSLDIVDYPGEWLLDLPLLNKSYAEFSSDSFDLARLESRRELASEWLAVADAIDADAQADEVTAQRLARSFTGYLKAGKA
ncbi:YcjX family protein, partial [Serratia marcescens]|uniref:YcjX family protein n=2 Tax=Pseudomonadota TaxID=1224 RepID=UPI001954FB44